MKRLLLSAVLTLAFTANVKAMDGALPMHECEYAATVWDILMDMHDAGFEADQAFELLGQERSLQAFAPSTHAKEWVDIILSSALRMWALVPPADATDEEFKYMKGKADDFFILCSADGQARS